MSRRRAAHTRELIPDARYKSVLVAKCINILMRGGKKATSERILYSAMERIGQVLKKSSLEIFEQLVDNVRTSVEVCSRRFGGVNYQIPREISDKRSISLAIKWIVCAANKRKAMAAQDKLYEEMMDAYNNKGAAIKIRDDVHKLAEANRAFAHFRW